MKKAPMLPPVELPSEILAVLEDMALDNLLTAEMLGYIALNAEALGAEVTVITSDTTH